MVYNMNYGLTEKGFVKKSYEEIFENIGEDIRGIDNTAVLTDESVYGQLRALFSSQIYDLWNVLEYMWTQNSVTSSSGSSLDDLCALVNVYRLPATYSTVANFRVYGAQGSIINDGFRVASTLDATVKFETDDTYIIDTLDTSTNTYYASMLLTCTETGPTVAPTGTLTVVETNYDFITNVVQIQDADVGSNIETDSELKVRRLAVLANSSSSTKDGIESHLLTVKDNASGVGVEYAMVQYNDSSVVDSRGRPAHTIECIVYQTGGATSIDSLVGTGIQDSRAAGTETFGTESVTVKDSSDRSITIHFTRPVEVPIYSTMHLFVSELLTNDEIDSIKNDVVAQFDLYGIGKDVAVIGANSVSDALTNSKIMGANVLLGTSLSSISNTYIRIDNGEVNIPEIAITDSTSIVITQEVAT